MCVFAHDNSDLNLSDTNYSSVVSDCDNITNQQDNNETESFLFATLNPLIIKLRPFVLLHYI